MRRKPGSQSQSSTVDTIVRVVIFGGLVIAALIIVPRFLAGRKAKEKWDAAVEASDARKYKKAIGLYKEAKKIAPDYVGEKYGVEIAKAYLGYARELRDADEHRAAGDAFAAVIKNDPASAKKNECYLSGAQAYMRGQKIDKALKVARQGLRAHQNKNKSLANLIKLLKKKKSRAKEE